MNLGRPWESALPAPEIDARPALEQERLALGQVGPHGKIGLRQEDGRAVVGGHGLADSGRRARLGGRGEKTRQRVPGPQARTGRLIRVICRSSFLINGLAFSFLS